jgi:hypothetical protein
MEVGLPVLSGEQLYHRRANLGELAHVALSQDEQSEQLEILDMGNRRLLG